MDLIVPQANALAALRSLFPVQNSDLSEGASLGFPVITFRGKVWRQTINGLSKVLENEEGEARQSINVVIVKSSPTVTKTYYKGTYVEGSDDAPDCASSDGVVPDPGVPAKQSDTCAVCKWNQWGSRQSDTATASKGKACSDNRRIAVVPYPHIESEEGPSLLRIPPASLGSLVSLADELNRLQLPYQAVVVKISFDVENAYPKLVFKPVKVLSEKEAGVIAGLMQADALTNIFRQPVSAGTRPAPTEQAQPTPAAAKPAAKPAAAKAPPVEEPPVEEPPVEEPVAGELSGDLGDLDLEEMSDLLKGI
jgi:hypothetical protein